MNQSSICFWLMVTLVCISEPERPSTHLLRWQRAFCWRYFHGVVRVHVMWLLLPKRYWLGLVHFNVLWSFLPVPFTYATAYYSSRIKHLSIREKSSRIYFQVYSWIFWRIRWQQRFPNMNPIDYLWVLLENSIPPWNPSPKELCTAIAMAIFQEVFWADVKSMPG